MLIGHSGGAALVGVADWWAWVLFGLLLVAIAELVAHGVTLQELDEATI